MSRSAAILISLALPWMGVAAETGSSGSLYDGALRAIDEGIPEVGIEKLRQALAENPSPEIAAEAPWKMARALLDTGRAEEAWKTVEPLLSGNDSNRDFLKARILTALGRWGEAEPLFRTLSGSPDSALAVEAKLGEAAALNALGNPVAAVTVLEAVPNPSPEVRLRLADLYFETHAIQKCEAILSSVKPDTVSGAQWKAYLGGRLLLSQGRAAEALEKFESVVRDTRGACESLLAGATLGIAEARIVLNGTQHAGNILEDFIWRHPGSAFLDLMFRRLDQIYANEESPSDVELNKWAQSAPAQRQALAVYYLARAEQRAKKPDLALQTLDTFMRDFSNHPYAFQALLLRGNLLLGQGKNATALLMFEGAMRRAPDPESLARTEMAAGRAYFSERQYVLSANMFRAAAGHSRNLWQPAMFNAALAWLNQGNYEMFLADYKQLSAKYPESDFRRELLLEEGLMQARSGDASAKESLRLFIRDFPENLRVADARLALAEISYRTADLTGASAYLKAVNETPQSIGTSDRAAYLAIFLADSAEPRDEQKVIDLCLRFLQDRRQSSLGLEVRMKLGQIYFRREDFANARTQFELLAAESPGTAYGETALFLAGQSAMQSLNSGGTDRALELFEQVAKLNGPLKLYARQQQAILKTQLGMESEAVILYDNILGSKPEPELRFAALCGKGDDYFSMGNSDPKALAQAVAAFDELAGDREVTAFWRNQALYKKGKCLVKQARPDEALAVFYDVLQTGPATGGPDYFWYYKAGFDAARMLEERQQWQSAIGIYRKMAGVKGPRSDEASERARQLRMEHFLWEN